MAANRTNFFYWYTIKMTKIDHEWLILSVLLAAVVVGVTIFLIIKKERFADGEEEGTNALKTGGVEDAAKDAAAAEKAAQEAEARGKTKAASAARTKANAAAKTLVDKAADAMGATPEEQSQMRETLNKIGGYRGIVEAITSTPESTNKGQAKLANLIKGSLGMVDKAFADASGKFADFKQANIKVEAASEAHADAVKNLYDQREGAPDPNDPHATGTPDIPGCPSKVRSG